MLKLRKPDLKILARINISLLTPALMFSKISGSLDRDTLFRLWLVPVLYGLLGYAGYLWVQYAGRRIKLPDGYKRLCGIAVFFSNVNTIMVPIVQTIAASPTAEYLLRDDDDTPEELANRCIAYGMLVSIINNLLRWSVGVALMLPEQHGPMEEMPGTLSPIPMRASPGRESEQSSLSDYSDEQLEVGMLSLRPAHGVVATAANACVRIWARIQPCMTPPLVAVITAVLVVLVPAVQDMLLAEGTYAFTLWKAIDTCGEACIPLTLLALGGQLYVMEDRDAEFETSSSTDVSKRTQEHGIMLVMMGRFLVVPTLMCLSLFIVHMLFPMLMPLLQQDPVLFLTLALVSATPPAVNLLTMSQKMGLYENESARILTYCYIMGIFVLSVEVSVFLWLTSLL
ncbi:hypothetical protein DL89DRAFT_61990 [Linderina pennispora]|uniref:Auxin efflux carrier n=1 Tax=Linderina pennispora TaxID=61395 RepID=A0A1Y1W0W2_9FUNG|nr:uncharacterized protein DL89DRAFT_61990 [Linderina pennispora]ORX66945.1 hypothetical protein DL89DRAFT_61990 [Linderina pennispora]